MFVGDPLFDHALWQFIGYGMSKRTWRRLGSAATGASKGELSWASNEGSFQSRVAEDWPAIEGRIVMAKVEKRDIGEYRRPPDNIGYYAAILTYSYFVQEYRSGEYIREFVNEADADDFVRQADDKKVKVRYDPQRPNRSLLDPSAIEQYVPVAGRGN